jgi:ribosomal-protein-alanine N-acetyltransferase
VHGVNVLETPRLVLRGWRESDVHAWAEMNADPRVMEFFASTYSLEQSLNSAARMREDLERTGHGWWVVSVKGDAPFAGVISLQPVPFEIPGVTPAFEVGWRFRADQWGRGYATEGAQAVLSFAFYQLDLAEVVAITAALNVRSQRVMERLGMRREPESDFTHPRLEAGHPLAPHVLYRIVRGEARPHT